MTTKEIIDKVLKAKTTIELFTDLSNWKKTYREYSKIHPDVCSEVNSVEAFTKLNKFKDELQNGKKHNDDAGVVTYTLNSIEIIGDEKFLKWSYENYLHLMSFTDSASMHFQKYLPSSAEMLSENELCFKIPMRAIPLSQIGTLEQKHVNWILSRLLEFCGWLNQNAICHAGITPDSIYVTPENHGIICISFYHMAVLDSKLGTISGRYQQFYPAKLFSNKKASSNIDVELSKRTAIYLLGDQSGSGVKLRKTHNEEIIDFLQQQDFDALETYDKYRAIIRKHFDTKQFHSLTI